MSFTSENEPTSNDSIEAATGPPNLADQAVYRRIKPIVGEQSGTVFSAIHRRTGKAVHIRLFPLLRSHPTLLDSFEKQLRLIKVAGDKLCHRIVESSLDEDPPRVIMVAEPGIRLNEFTSKATPFECLLLASELIAAISDATLSGLFHGNINRESIRVIGGLGATKKIRCRLNYLARFEDEKLALRDEDELFDGEVESTLQVVLDIVSPLVRDNKLPDLDARLRAQLKQLVNQSDSGAGVAVTQYESWLALLLNWRDAFELSLTQESHHSNSYSGTSFTSSGQDSFSSGDLTDQTSVDHVVPRDILDDSATKEDLDGNDTELEKQQMPRLGEALGRFRLDEIAGEGGMGVVFKATDLGTEQLVAVKVLRASGKDSSKAIRRFKKEARLLANIQNNFVTRLIESGVKGEFHYLAMEYVEGTDLKKWLKCLTRKSESVGETDALNLVADVARALVDAHQQEIIHRDIKPENILLARKQSADAAVDSNELGIENVSVKLSDFGIARHVQQTDSMDMTRAGSFLGTPHYMSPEQCKGDAEITPATDIYAIGILLFQLLTGRLPFTSSDPMKLAAMHCFDEAPSVMRINSNISETTASLVARMLAKDPLQRLGDAGQLVRKLTQIINGEANSFEAHPRLPESTNLWERDFSWKLKSSSQELWPLISNTERLNKAIGMQSVEYRTEKDEIGTLRKFGSFRLAGMLIAWEEHPFEWVEGTRMGILREFETGPFVWFMSSVELVPLSGGGTELIHRVKIQPRNTIGRVISTLEAGWKGKRALDKVYNRIDETLQKAKANEAQQDPFETPKKLASVEAERLRMRIQEAVDNGVDEKVASKLEHYLATAASQALAQIQPYRLAAQLNVGRDEMLDACLIAANCGLLKLQWDIICPTCRAPASNEELLSDIKNHTECEVCDVEFQSNIGNAIELVFQADSEIRTVDEGHYCSGGPVHSPHVVTQLRIEPGEQLEVEVNLTRGDYLLRGVGSTQRQRLRVKANNAPSQLDLRLSHLGTISNVPVLRAGPIAISLLNDETHPRVVRVERTVERENIVTAAAISADAKFRSLFPEQTFDEGTPVATEELALFWATVTNVDEVYQLRSEPEAYLLFQQLLQEIETVVNDHQGAVTKTVGEGLMASFQDRSKAVAASLAIREAMRASDKFGGLKIGIGVHRSRTLVTTQNGRLDYFGAAVRLVETLAKKAEQGVLMTATVFADPASQAILKQFKVKPETVVIDLGLSSNDAEQILQKISFTSKDKS